VSANVDSGRSVVLSVGGMTCPTCEQSLERTMGRLPGVRSVRANHRAGSVEVEFDLLPAEDVLRRMVEDTGYELEGFGHEIAG
jgi:copper chaperone CopZ